MHGMEETLEFKELEFTKFNNSKTILLRLVFKDSEDFRHTLSTVIDDLNSVEYSLKIASDEVISLLSLTKFVPQALECACTCLTVSNVVYFNKLDYSNHWLIWSNPSEKQGGNQMMSQENGKKKCL